MSPPRMLALVAARLNSSRLPGKQLLDLAGRPLIERIFERLDRVPGLVSVLATTADDCNRPLVAWAAGAGRDCFAYGGDVNDLVGRIDAVVEARDPELICYVCGDSPLVEPTLIARLLAALRDDAAAEVAVLAPPPPDQAYIHEGVLTVSRRGWQRLVAASHTAPEREHVGVGLRKLSDLRAAFVTEEPLYWRRRQRISVDTTADYRFMAEVYRRWYAQHGADTVVSLAWVIEELDRDPGLAAVNAHVRQKGVGERPPRVTVVLPAEPGRLGPILPVVRALQEVMKADVSLALLGESFDDPALAAIRHRFGSDPEMLALSGADLLLVDAPGRIALPAGPRVASLAACGLVQLASPTALSARDGPERFVAAVGALLA